MLATPLMRFSSMPRVIVLLHQPMYMKLQLVDSHPDIIFQNTLTVFPVTMPSCPRTEAVNTRFDILHRWDINVCSSLFTSCVMLQTTVPQFHQSTNFPSSIGRSQGKLQVLCNVFGGEHTTLCMTMTPRIAQSGPLAGMAKLKKKCMNRAATGVLTSEQIFKKRTFLCRSPCQSLMTTVHCALSKAQGELLF